ncbi:MAG: type II toxin-antitoxin system VapC family toxin [Coriobacteriia bacterium]|nr:type II toxin-antitoxin system VapC family toxin [Coriobacteriia bacterium]
MSAERSTYVLDASVGVKWFKNEQGSGRARELYLQSASGDIALAAPTHFFHEVLAVVKREMTARAIPEGWRHIKASGIAVLPLSDEVVAEAAAQCDALGCSFYDALAPACASLLGATLASADERAHGAYPGVHLIPGPAS